MIPADQSPKKIILNYLNQLLARKKLEERINKEFDGSYFVFEKTIGNQSIWEQGEVIYQLKNGELIEVHNPFDQTEYGVLESDLGLSTDLVQEWIKENRLRVIYTIKGIKEFSNIFFNLNLKEDSEQDFNGDYQYFYQVKPLENSVAYKNHFGEKCKYQSLRDIL